MKMINVLQRLSELDEKNPNVANPFAAGQKRVMEADQIAQLPELSDMGDLRALSGLKPLAECDMMPMGGAMEGMHSRPPASFSINATAADGAEVSAMLGDILNLAGVHKVGPEHMPGVDAHGGHVNQAQIMPAEKDSMRKAMDVIDEPAGPGEMDDEGLGMGAAGAGLGLAVGGPLGAVVGGGLGGSMEDEGIKGAALGGVGGAMLGGPLGALTGAAAGSTVGDAIDDEGMGSGNSEMSSMADEIRSMADRLSKIEDLDELPGVEGGEEKADEAWDNSPADPTNVPLGNTNDFAYNPNAASGGVNKGMTNMPSAMAEDLESQLFADYKNFVSESKKKADVKENLHHHAGPKIDQKDVHRVVDCAYSSGVPLMHEDSGCVMDCMSSYPKEHARLTNKYNECWEEFHNKCCDHYHSKNKMGEQLSSTGVAGVGVLPEGKKTMSQAAKGNEKYGKTGMQALAKARREGKSLKPVKAKYNKYN